MIGERGYYASAAGRMASLLGVVYQSRALRVLQSRIGRQHARISTSDGRMRLHPVQQRYVTYLLQPPEVFARAYAQYITLRSAHPALQQQLQRIRGATLSGQVYHSQWSDDDFAPIAEAFDLLMRGRGWIQ